METPNKKLNVDPTLKSNISSLYAYMAKKLAIKSPPKIVLTDNKGNSQKPFGMTAYYDPEKKIIRVYITGRHPTDIMRSFAHELVHHWQNEHQSLKGSKHETHDHYAQKDPILRQREKEAYLFGNMLFRDWQDEQRYGPVNENLEVSKPDEVRKVLTASLLGLIKSGAIQSFHRAATSGDMNPADFVEEMARKLELELDKFLQVVDNKGNWENQQDMISESVNKVRHFIIKEIKAAILEERVKKTKRL